MQEAAATIVEDQEEKKLPYAYLFYPNFPFRKPRERLLATLRTDHIHKQVLLEAEDGRQWAFGYDDYAKAALVVARERITCFTGFVEGSGKFPWLEQVINDNRASIHCTARGTITTITIQRGHNKGTFAAPKGWHTDELEYADDGMEQDVRRRAIHDIRRVGELLEVGIYDTAAAAGTASLTKYWQDAKLKHLMRCPGAMEELFDLYSIGGRVEHQGLGRLVSTCFEVDVTGAYPSVVAQGLPWGLPAYCAEDAEPATGGDYGAIGYGYWEIEVLERIEHSPIPDRLWSIRDSRVSWTLLPWEESQKTRILTIAAWTPEIEALRATGKARARWLWGWSWQTLSQALRPWVERLMDYRKAMERSGEKNIAKLVKIVLNSTIGRWGMSGHFSKLVPAEESVEGDALYELPEWAFVAKEQQEGEQLPAMMAVHSDDGMGNALPRHWASYIRMVVRMEIYRILQQELAHGNELLLANCDALVMTTCPNTEHSLFVWKHTEMHEAHFVKSRSIVYWELQPNGLYKKVSKLPGIGRESVQRKEIERAASQQEPHPQLAGVGRLHKHLQTCHT